MLLADLSNLIKSRSFEEAASRVRSEKIRLRSEGLSHPIIDLLQAFSWSEFVSPNRWYSDRLPPEQTQALERQMVDLLDAMLDAGTPPGFMPSRRSSRLSNDEELRLHLGLGHNGRSHSPYDVQDGSLYVRMAGLNWVEGMQLLLRRGYKPDAEEVDSALVNAVRTQKAGSLRHLLENHDIQGRGWWEHRNSLLGRLFRWEGAPASDVAQVFKAYSQERTHEWVKDSHNNMGINATTALQWLAQEPGAWKSLHDRLVAERAQRPDDDLSPGLWTTLFREYVEHGRFAALLDEALTDGSFEHWKNRFPYKDGATLGSWIVQGGPINPPPAPTQDYKGEWSAQAPASQRTFAQLRRARLLLDRLRDQGVGLRIGASCDVSEAMDWSATGRVPTPAFIHRHSEFLLPSASLASPLHTAETPEVALAWEAMGASATPDKSGVDPWVASMQASSSPAAWGREVAARLKAGRIDPDARGSEGVSLAAVATKSPPLARLWLKKSKRPLSVDMFEAALRDEQWALAAEWIEEGRMDEAPELRQVFFKRLRSMPHSMTDNATKLWNQMVDAAMVRPTRPWEEQAEAWRGVAQAGRGYNNHMDKFEDTLARLGDWGTEEQSRALWQPSDWELVKGVVRNCEAWLGAMPITLTEEEGVRLFWEVILEPEASTSTRKRHAQRVWAAFDETLPVGRGNQENFERMRQMDEESHGGLGSSSQSFSAFMEAEELLAATVVAAPARAATRARL